MPETKGYRVLVIRKHFSYGKLSIWLGIIITLLASIGFGARQLVMALQPSSLQTTYKRVPSSVQNSFPGDKKATVKKTASPSPSPTTSPSASPKASSTPKATSAPTPSASASVSPSPSVSPTPTPSPSTEPEPEPSDPPVEE